MNRTRIMGTVAAVVAALVLPAAALAQQGGDSWNTDLQAQNGSGATGSAELSIDGDQVTVRITTEGVSPDVPHAQHIHIGGENRCPTADADGDGDGVVSVVEGLPFYGDIMVSLTTTGDVGMSSGLAVDRFPSGEGGSYTYERTFSLPEGVTAEDLQRGVFVVHGFAELGGDTATYDGDPSDLDPNVPMEATLPVLCGPLAGSQDATGTGTPAAGGAQATTTPAAGTQGGAQATSTPAAGTQGGARATSTPATGTQGSAQATATPAGGVRAGSGGTATESGSNAGTLALIGLAMTAVAGAGVLLWTRRREDVRTDR